MRSWPAVLVVCACARGMPPPVAVENRGGTASVSCELPARLEFEARRYANVDADDPARDVWSPWRVGLQLQSATSGTLAMVGDDLTWTFDVTGRVRDCTIDMTSTSHDPFSITIDLRSRTGWIRSIDDTWRLGP